MDPRRHISVKFSPGGRTYSFLLPEVHLDGERRPAVDPRSALCCTTWLPTFEPVSTKLAKQQNLSLSPSKLSGMCGRLECCLRYELPNARGVVHRGCGEEGGCGSGGCGSGGCGKCGPP